MKKRNQVAAVVGASLDEVLEADGQVSDERKVKSNAVDQRFDKLQGIAHEKAGVRGTPAENVLRRRVDPGVCRMWEQHNRRYELLNEQRCAELITDVRAKGQQFPAIVRELYADPDYTYEVVCGARRHWVASFLGEDYFIEVRKVTDEEAFLLADSENRSREDISDFERGLDYQRALKRYYSSARKMAAALDVSDTWLGKFLALAKLPQEILDAYPSVLDLKVDHARKLCKLVESDDDHEAIIEKALALKDSGKTGAIIYRELCGVEKKKRSGRGGRLVEETYQHNGKDAVTYKKTSRGGTQIVLHRKSGASLEEMESLVVKALNEQWGE